MADESNRPIFEHGTCGRCGGTGRHSYNLMHGWVCYGCDGSGWKLTKRGEAAQKYYRAKYVEVTPATVQVGDVINTSHYASHISVAAVATRDSGTAIIAPDGTRVAFIDVVVTGVNGKEYTIGSYRADGNPNIVTNQVKRVLHGDALAAAKADALAFQSTLSKKGALLKRKVA